MMNKEGGKTKKLRKKQRTPQVCEEYDCHQMIIIKKYRFAHQTIWFNQLSFTI